MNRRSELGIANAVVHTMFTGRNPLPNTLSRTMTATSRSLEDEPPLGGGAQTVDDEAATKPTTEPAIGVSVAGDRCAVCGAELAPDQRYCVECGTRRGAPRFSANLPSQAAPASAPATRPTARRPSTMLAIVAVATLLIAFGVGILIGHDTSSKAPTVTVQSSGAGSSGGSSSSGSNSNSSGGSSSSGSSSGSTPKAGAAPPKFH
jgi:hypothetical protein